MPKLEVKRKLNARSERVKSVDLHPTEPWVLASLYNGSISIWDYKTESLVKSFELTDLPARCARFIARKQWIIAGADDMMIRVYNYNTMAKVKVFEAHTDYIRSLAVHPTQPFVLSSSDDMLIKLWNWDKGWQCTQVFEGHNHYVMNVVFNPKDTNTFASASLDRTIKVWSISSPVPNFTLEGHERGVNSVEYFSGGDKPYLVSGADDKTVKVWDYLNKSCVQTLEGHTHNVSVICFHPTLPLLISGSEDSTVRIWNANTFRLEKTLNYGMERVWSLAYLKGSNSIAVGYDEGTVIIKFGSEEPAVSMDNNGKIIWAKQNEIQQVNIKTSTPPADGEKLILPVRDLGTSEVFPQSLKHSSNGRFVVVCGDGEFIIYTALAWRNKSFGKALEFGWGIDTGEYVVRESSSKIKVFKNFKETHSIKVNFSVEGIFGGRLIALRSTSFICFYDWNESKVVRRIDVTPKSIYWSDSGELLVISCESSFYILKYNADVVATALASGETIPEEGLEDAFEVLREINERVRSGIWVEDCFIYTNANRLNYCVGSEIVTLAHLDCTMYPLGYIPKTSRIYVADKSLNLTSYSLDITTINYQTAILRGDFKAAEQILPKIAPDQRNRIAQFLEKQNYKEMAMNIATDVDIKFELAIQLNKLATAYSIAKEVNSEAKWKQLGDIAISLGELDLARECLVSAQDINGLLLISIASGDFKGLISIAAKAKDEGHNNISFLCYFLCNQLDECISLLCETGRIPEAAFLARTYKPSKVSSIISLWKNELKKVNEKAANSLADPNEYPNLFPDWELALQAEQLFPFQVRPASAYPFWKEKIRYMNFIEEIRNGNIPKSPQVAQVSVEQPAVQQVVVQLSEEQNENKQEQLQLEKQETSVPDTEELKDDDLDIDVDNLISNDLDLDENDIAIDDFEVDVDDI